MHGYYILDGTQPVPVDDVLTLARWFETTERHVADTELYEGVRVSTVFLGLDHNSWGGPPLLWETMVFWEGSALHNEMERYATWGQAEQGHEAMCARVRAAVEAQRVQSYAAGARRED